MESIKGIFEETVGRGIVLTLEEMEVILYGFIIKNKQVTFMMQSHMGQTLGIVGECTLAFTGFGYGFTEPYAL
jgi:hypothetical protein